MIGIVEWFAMDEHARVERVVEELRKLGVTRLRTGVSWADWYTGRGGAWYDWLLPRLAREVEVLPCLLYTPPSLGVAPRTSAPPRDPRAYADFVDLFLSRYGRHVEYVELWNEPNNVIEWDWTLDHQWLTFCEMVGAAAHWARRRGFRTVLGGTSPPDPNWVELMGERGVLRYVDAVGFHGFPGTWEAAWDGWASPVARMQEALERQGSSAAVWITEAGFSTWRHDEHGQVRAFLEAASAPAERVYWYGAEDLADTRLASGSFHADEREYHFGLHRTGGEPKLLARLLEAGDPAELERVGALGRETGERTADVLVTGAAGARGRALVERLVGEGTRVRMLDNLSQPGSEAVLERLAEAHPTRVAVEIADVRDRLALRRALTGVGRVFHLARAAAGDSPRVRFDVDVGGTVNLLDEAAAGSLSPVIVLGNPDPYVHDYARQVGVRLHPLEAQERAEAAVR